MTNPSPTPRKRHTTPGAISVPELPWKRERHADAWDWGGSDLRPSKDRPPARDYAGHVDPPDDSYDQACHSPFDCI